MISLTGKTAQLISQIEGCLARFLHTHTIGSPHSLTLSHSHRGFPENGGLNFVLILTFFSRPADPFWPSEGSANVALCETSFEGETKNHIIERKKWNV